MSSKGWALNSSGEAVEIWNHIQTLMRKEDHVHTSRIRDVIRA
jgi:hypothetical protein